jgi:hypothetical protein
MYMYTKNKKADRLYVFENALAINKVARNFYNQLKGTTINCFFEAGISIISAPKATRKASIISRTMIRLYTGVNRAHADIIDMVFAPKLDSAGNVALDSAGKPKGKELNASYSAATPKVR